MGLVSLLTFLGGQYFVRGIAKPLLSVALLTVVVAVFFVSSAFEQKLQSAGYVECSNTQQMTRSEFKTFVLDPTLCE